MATRGRLLNALLGWALFTAVVPTVIIYRAVVQPEYGWGLFGIAGRGAAPELVVIAAAATLAWAAVFRGSARRRDTGPLLAFVFGIWLLSLVAAVIRVGSDLTLRGDAWGVAINVAYVGPLLFGVLFALSVWWWWSRSGRDTADRPVLPRDHRSRLWKWLALTPAILILFGLGGGAVHTWNDRIAVVLAVVQCVAIGATLRVDEVATADRPATQS